MMTTMMIDSCQRGEEIRQHHHAKISPKMIAREVNEGTTKQFYLRRKTMMIYSSMSAVPPHGEREKKGRKKTKREVGSFHSLSLSRSPPIRLPEERREVLSKRLRQDE